MITPNVMSIGWRIALAAAAQALRSGESVLPADELHQRIKLLADERDATQRLLEDDARVEHISLVRRLSLPTMSSRQLGLPGDVDACVFDLDGVLAPSDDASHYARLSRFTDYGEFLRGRPRLDGVRTFLFSRGISLPEGSESDPPGAETVYGIANAKNRALHERLTRDGITAFAGSARYLEDVVHAGLATAVVSPSANADSILSRAGLEDLVDVIAIGPTAQTRAAACEQLHISPSHVAAFETSATGVAASRAAGIGLVNRIMNGLGDWGNVN